MKQPHAHIIMHVPYEGPSAFATWFEEQSWSLSYTKVWEAHGNLSLPLPESFDVLLVMGGPMSCYDADPALKMEINLISATLTAGKTVIGVCLGSQLLAAALGASVYPMKQKEIGWYPIEPALPSTSFPKVPTWIGAVQRALSPLSQQAVFHWHGDTFDLPQGAIWLASSEHCLHQAYIVSEGYGLAKGIKGRGIGLQFHIETSPEAIADMVEQGISQIEAQDAGSSVMSADEINDQAALLCPQTQSMLEGMLRALQPA